MKAIVNDNAGWITHVARRGGRRINHYFPNGIDKSMCNRVARSDGPIMTDSPESEACAVCKIRKGDQTSFKPGKTVKRFV